jgi:hypothetical protein
MPVIIELDDHMVATIQQHRAGKIPPHFNDRLLSIVYHAIDSVLADREGSPHTAVLGRYPSVSDIQRARTRQRRTPDLRSINRKVEP